MSLIIDIGNTSSKLYLIEKGRVIKSGLYERDMSKWIRSGSGKDGVVIASVVPERTKTVSAEVNKLTGKTPSVIKHSHFSSLKSRYLNIGELGIDRLCNVAFALEYYKKNIVVIDLGSAVTFEIINSQGEFEGGMIFPGIKLQYDALAKNTALLPDLKAEVTDLFIGRSTAECIRSGVQNGVAGACNDFVRELTARMSSRLKVILSGGDAELISKLVDFDHSIEPFTVPIGAWLISRMGKEK